jgi:putative transcription factor
MECELCGKKATAKAKIEGIVISVCENCAKLGERVLEAKPVQMREKPKIKIEETTIDPNFAKIVKETRESLGIKREELAKRINEKLSVIERIEHGSRPTDKIARKLEKVLGIKLLDYEEKEYRQTKTKDEPLTLGDVVKIKTRKK